MVLKRLLTLQSPPAVLIEEGLNPTSSILGIKKEIQNKSHKRGSKRNTMFLKGILKQK